MSGQQMHRRKTSKDEDENIIIVTTPPTQDPAPNGGIPAVIADAPQLPRPRVHSSPQHPHTRSSSSSLPPSAGPFRTGFNLPRPPALNGINGNGQHPSSPFRSSFALPVPGSQPSSAGLGGGHSRTRSISAFSPALPSPLSVSFPANPGPTSPAMYSFPAGSPNGTSELTPTDAPATSPTTSTRRHARLHSRNLSVFFPRPGSLPTAAIDEDGGQEIEVPTDIEAVHMPAAGPSFRLPGSRETKQPPTPLGQGFTFGARAPSPISSSGSPGSAVFEDELLTGPRAKRRGHHHKHSMSHNFFSFLEPGSAGSNGNGNVSPSDPSTDNGRQEVLHTQPTPVPMSPWAPISAFPQSAVPGSSGGFPHTPVTSSLQQQQQNGNVSAYAHDAIVPREAIAAGVMQFALGAWLWVRGQQVGSLAVTGVGYWVVFDAFGIGIARVAPGWLASGWGTTGKSFGEKERERMRRPYGNARVETVFAFAQAVYLMFAAVYVCKETVEHLLLSSGGGEGHHHHHGDEDEGLPIEFPLFILILTFTSILSTALVFDNHSKLVNVSGNRIPSPLTILRSLSSSSRNLHVDSSPTIPLLLALSNPFVAAPLAFCAAILFVALGIPAAQHRSADLILAALIAIVTFNVAYRACVVIGTVLLQTSPPRGMQNGKMEAFLRVMREVERHPQVLHLPAPHIWQLAPSSPYAIANSSHAKSPADSLVVTLQLHVREDLGDDDVLKLTKWAWDKCVAALGHAGKAMSGETGVPEVTVGVVRG